MSVLRLRLWSRSNNIRVVILFSTVPKLLTRCVNMPQTMIVGTVVMRLTVAVNRVLVTFGVMIVRPAARARVTLTKSPTTF